MSTIKTNPAIPGKVATAAEANATYAAIQTGTAALSDLNEQTEWATWNHIDTVTDEQVFTTDMQTYCNALDYYVLTSESYVVINLGGTDPVRLNWTPALTYNFSGELLRVHADINLDAVDANFALPALLLSNQDVFYLQLWYRDGNNNYHAVDCEFGYSVTNYIDQDVSNVEYTNGTFHDFTSNFASYCNTHPRHRFRCSITGFIPIVASGINRVELRARLDDNVVLPSVTFREATMVAVMVRH